LAASAVISILDKNGPARYDGDGSTTGKLMSSQTDVLETALEQERARNGRQIATFRLVATTAVFLLNSAFLGLRSTYVGASTVSLAAYCLMAFVLWWSQRRVSWLARWGGLAIAFIDMPVIYVVVSSVMRQLSAKGFADDAAAVATQACLFYLVFIWAASLTTG
jgi:hypothetical protein